MTDCGVSLEYKGPSSLKSIIRLSTVATPEQMSGEGRDPLSAHVQCVEAAGWKMPSWWVISPAFVGPPKLPVRKSALVLATHSPGAGSPPVPRSGQKAISFLWIRPILYALIPEFNVSLRFGPQHFGIAST